MHELSRYDMRSRAAAKSFHAGWTTAPVCVSNLWCELTLSHRQGCPARVEIPAGSPGGAGGSGKGARARGDTARTLVLDRAGTEGARRA